jgi:hypothetical protein
MGRRLAVLFAAALLTAPAAAAAGGPGPAALQGGSGVLSPDGLLRYVAIGVGTGDWTSLQAIRTDDGQVLHTTNLAGDWGFPWLFGGTSLSHDGSTLVLAHTQISDQSRFLVYDPRTMKYLGAVVLNGRFTFDALSPDGSRLYLIQQMYGDGLHYIVRAYDLRRERLLPGRIADRTQKSWVMQGYPVTRTTSGDGRMVYTLYQNPGGYPFVHALDTVRGVAHCVGIPMTGGQEMLYNVVLALHGKRLAVHWRSGRPWYDIDTTTWRVSPAHGGFPWWTLSFAALPLLGVPALLLRRRRRQELDEELADLLRLPERQPADVDAG